MNVVELGQCTNIRPPSKIIHDEAFHACSLCRINHGTLMVNAGRPYNADGSILPEQSLD